MSGAFPEVITPRRSVTLGGQRFAKDRLSAEIQAQSLADVRAFIRQITREVTTEQTAAGNPPTLLEVDGKTNKDVEAVDSKTVVIFGTPLAAAAMREVESALRAAIQRSTKIHTGRLQDVSGHWSWRYLPAGGRAGRMVTAGSTLPTFAPGDRLVLLPERVPHATLTNRNVARSGRADVKPRKGRPPPKSRQNRGFMFYAVDALRKRSAFAQFHVKVGNSRAHMVAGELMTQTLGTMVIVISPRVRRLK